MTPKSKPLSPRDASILAAIALVQRKNAQLSKESPLVQDLLSRGDHAAEIACAIVGGSAESCAAGPRSAGGARATNEVAASIRTWASHQKRSSESD